MSTLAATNLKHESSASNNIVLTSGGDVGIGTGNLTFNSTAQRITGDFSNATIANRVMFQTSTTNSSTGVIAIPNGTGSSSTFIVTNSSDVANTSFGQINISSSLGFQLQSSVTGTGTYYPMTFYTGGSERMRLDTSGNVGIGTSSPVSYGLSVAKASGTAGLRVSSGANLADFAINGVDLYVVNNANGPMNFYTNAAERARIDSSGNLLVGTTSTLFASSHAFVNSGTAVLGLRNSGSTAGKYWQVGPDSNSSFKVYNQSSTGVFLSDGSTSWSSSSDERQKNIIEPISDATKKVASLRAVIGSYKSDETNKRRSFLIAQDVQQVLPEAVTEAPDGFLGVAYSDVIPLLVAAIQELSAKVAALEAKQ